ARRPELGDHAQLRVVARGDLLQEQPSLHPCAGDRDRSSAAGAGHDHPVARRHLQSQAARGLSMASRLLQPNGQGREEPVLMVEGLTVEYRTPAGVVCAVRDVSFDLHLNESLALIGESGCGKTTLGLALLRLLPKLGRTSAGAIRYRNRDGHVIDLLELDSDELREFRWKECAMVFQGAMNSFNPVLRVWDQMLDTVRAHRAMPRDEVRERSVKLLRMVQLEPDRILK